MSNQNSKKDWVGTTKSVYKIMGATNHAIDKDREFNDYYATSPITIDKRLHR